MEAYLDNAATTRCSRPVCELVMKIMGEDYGNPSSMHQKGVEAERYMREAASRIARKFVDTVTENFDRDGALYERYNVVTGEPGKAGGGEPALFSGWTAGTFVFAAGYLKRHNV